MHFQLRPQYRRSRNPLFHKKNESKAVRSDVYSTEPEEVGEDSGAVEMTTKSPDRDVQDIR